MFRYDEELEIPNSTEKGGYVYSTDLPTKDSDYESRNRFIKRLADLEILKKRIIENKEKQVGQDKDSASDISFDLFNIEESPSDTQKPTGENKSSGEDNSRRSRTKLGISKT